jgi:UDP-glucose 4-epimerase
MTTVLLTGATGFIGSHLWLSLLDAGFDVVGVDNFSNSSPLVLPRIEALAERRLVFERLDVRDRSALDALFKRHAIDACVHLAALKAVGDSCERPLEYYRNNLDGLLALCEAMSARGGRRMVFSSSATVYGAPEVLPITESARLGPTNPYGRTKLFSEQILGDLCAADACWQVASLRYFNPVGAHPSGRIGEEPVGRPNNLMPFIAQVAVGRREHIDVFGADYATRDGTGVRDYIHVMDLAEGHVAALRRLIDHPGSFTVNLGTGRGTTVLELIAAYERASGKTIPYRIVGRRAGDVEALWADPSWARELLGWRAKFDVDRMCQDSWRWQVNNPRGYE